MPVEMLKKLPPKARKIWESVYEKMRDKGYSEAQSAKIAWGVVKKSYKKVGDKWVLKEKKVKKSHTVNKITVSKSSIGGYVLEGYLFDYNPDDYNEVLTPEFALDILPDIELGDLDHNPDTYGLFKIIDKKVDNNGLWVKVTLNKEHKDYQRAVEFIQQNKDKLGFSVEFSSPLIGGSELRKKGDKYYLHYLSGRGLGFAVTTQPVNKGAKAKVL